jgi:hypothetical protein
MFVKLHFCDVKSIFLTKDLVSLTPLPQTLQNLKLERLVDCFRETHS